MDTSLSLQILSIVLGSFISEDLACVAAGVLIAQGDLSWPAGLGAAATGLFLGDLLLYLAGRSFDLSGRVSPAKLASAKLRLERHEVLAVLLSRFVPGLRLPTYVAAGLLRLDFLRFSLALLLAVGIWTPLLVGATVWGLESSQAWLTYLIAAALILFALTRPGPRTFWRKYSQWEFWPAWAAYLPVAPYFLWLSVRHGSPTVFAAANPGIASGGLTGESKSAILRWLSRCPGATPYFTTAEAGSSPANWNRDYPLVAKPDVGERGQGVRIIRDAAQLKDYLSNARGLTILQDYVPGLEFGIFYARHPFADGGRILSITGKRFPTVTGDGSRSIRELIRQDKRAALLEAAYEDACRIPLDSIPAKGEVVALVEIGSHCRGTIFDDARALCTPQLEAAIDTIAHAHPDFYFGRFDIRVPSREDLQAGQGIQVLELNGVGAEPAHIYDPRVGILDAYRALFTHWRIAFETGAINLRLGAPPLRLCDLFKILDRRYIGVNRNSSAARYSPGLGPENCT
jgi:membrane protein DedA with SNARE-associated domain